MTIVVIYNVQTGTGSGILVPVYKNPFFERVRPSQAVSRKAAPLCSSNIVYAIDSRRSAYAVSTGPTAARTAGTAIGRQFKVLESLLRNYTVHTISIQDVYNDTPQLPPGTAETEMQEAYLQLTADKLRVSRRGTPNPGGSLHVVVSTARVLWLCVFSFFCTVKKTLGCTVLPFARSLCAKLHQ